MNLHHLSLWLISLQMILQTIDSRSQPDWSNHCARSQWQRSNYLIIKLGPMMVRPPNGFLAFNEIALEKTSCDSDSEPDESTGK